MVPETPHSQESVGQPLDAEEDVLITAQQGHMLPLCTSQIHSNVLLPVGILLSLLNERNVTVS